MPRNPPLGSEESSTDQDYVEAWGARRSVPRAADIGLEEERSANSVDVDKETAETYADHLAGMNMPIPGDAEPPVSVAAVSGGSDVLPTPRTAAAEALSGLSLGRDK